MPIEIQNHRLLPKELVIFYCWQDELNRKLHRFLIRDCLKSAIKLVQAELPNNADCVLRIDSDTSGKAGSINVADTILQKINASTIVVGDVTPVVSSGKPRRCHPNPNVMIELGFAARAIGWARIICVYNSAVFKPEQLPFDIRHRRVTPYRCRNSNQKTKASQELKSVFFVSLRAIIQEIGRGEFDLSITQPHLKHQRDLELLRDLMKNIHRPTMDNFIERGLVNRLHYDGLIFWEGFNAVVSSSQFRFYDQELQRLTLELHSVWGSAIYFSGLVLSPGNHPGSFVTKPTQFWDKTYKRQLNNMGKSYARLPAILKAFLDHVHTRYPEINMKESDQMAWRDNLPFISGSCFQSSGKNKFALQK